MIGSFPDPYPDELFYSVCARYSERMDYSNAEIVLLDLFGSRKIHAISDLPNYLGTCVANLPPGYNLGVDRLIDENTLWPFYSWFLPAERREDLRKEMCRSGGRGFYVRNGLMLTRASLPVFFRFCPLCAEQDRQLYGEAFWHRIHHLPGTWVCPVHAIPLHDSAARARIRTNPSEFIAAERVLSASSEDLSTSTRPYHETLLHIARDAAWLLQQNDLGPGLELLRQHYNEALHVRGLTSKTGNALPFVTAQRFQDHFPRPLLEMLGCSLETNAEDSWVRDILTRKNNVHNPLHYLLFIRFLGYTVDELLQLPLPKDFFGAGPWPCLNPVCDRYLKNQIEECKINYAYDGGVSGSFSCSCGFTYTRRGPDRSPEDRFRRGKVRAYGPVWDERLRRLWNDPTVTIQAAGHQLGVQPSTVTRQADRLGLPFPPPGSSVVTPVKMLASNKRTRYKFMERLTAYRLEWLVMVELYPEHGIYGLIVKASSAYAWLRANDREWLKANSPKTRRGRHARTRIDWENHDAQLAKQIDLAAQRLREKAGCPVWVTASAIAREVGNRDLLAFHRDKFPLTLETLHKEIETYEQFAIRRVRWAAKCYRDEGICPSRPQLVSRARAQNCARRPLIKEALDAALELLAAVGNTRQPGN